MKVQQIFDGKEKLADLFIKHANNVLTVSQAYPLFIKDNQICIDDFIEQFSDTIGQIRQCYDDFAAGYNAK